MGGGGGMGSRGCPSNPEYRTRAMPTRSRGMKREAATMKKEAASVVSSAVTKTE